MMTCRRLSLVIALLLSVAASANAQNCRKGKPCGNSCIARIKICHVGQGTARWAPGVTDTTSSATTKSSGTAPVELPNPLSQTVPELARATCTVTKITDGDTIRCAEYQKGVRLLLIDAPERDQGPYGALAKGALEQLLPAGTSARLEFDIQPADRYGRRLAYIWREDGVLVNEELARGGYVLSLTYPPNVKYVDRIRAAVEEAKEEKQGLWSGSAFECTPKDHRAKKC